MDKISLKDLFAILICMFFAMAFGVSLLDAAEPRGLLEVVREKSNLPRPYLERVFKRLPEENARVGINDYATAAQCEKMLLFRERYGELSPYALLNERSLAAGAVYYDRYNRILKKAYEKFGVSPEYVLAILRVETYFGVCLGDYFVLQRLYDIYMNADNDVDRNWASTQISAFLKLARRYDWNPYGVIGSSAGAFGMAQFLPRSFVYAIDGNQDNEIDLFNPADAIPSIASYLKVHGWSSDIADKKRAIWNYNHSDEYVARVIKYAHAARREIDRREMYFKSP